MLLTHMFWKRTRAGLTMASLTSIPKKLKAWIPSNDSFWRLYTKGLKQLDMPCQNFVVLRPAFL